MKRPHVQMSVDNLAVSTRCDSTLFAADRPVRDEDATTCCDAQSEKSWITDPQGL